MATESMLLTLNEECDNMRSRKRKERVPQLALLSLPLWPCLATPAKHGEARVREQIGAHLWIDEMLLQELPQFRSGEQLNASKCCGAPHADLSLLLRICCGCRMQTRPDLDGGFKCKRRTNRRCLSLLRTIHRRCRRSCKKKQGGIIKE